MAVNNRNQNPDIFDPVLKLSKLFDAKLKTIIFTKDNADKAKIRYDSKVSDDVKKRLDRQFPGNTIESALIYGTDFHQTIQEYVAKQTADMLVMLTRQRTFMQNLFKLSMTRQMAYHINIPLMSLKGDNF
jgi:nucleotide-binding universal stress UspA family protein